MLEKGIYPLTGLLLIVITILISPSEGASAEARARMNSGIGASVVIPSRGCTIITGRILFNSDSFGSGTTSDGSISIRCDRGVPYGISLDGGINSTQASRRMKNDGNAYLSYSLYQDRGRSLHWGNGSQFGSTKSSVGIGGREVHKIYGSASFTKTQGAGSYTDQVSVIIYY